jgi:hypothetical protein
VSLRLLLRPAAPSSLPYGAYVPCAVRKAALGTRQVRNLAAMLREMTEGRSHTLAGAPMREGRNAR